MIFSLAICSALISERNKSYFVNHKTNSFLVVKSGHMKGVSFNDASFQNFRNFNKSLRLDFGIPSLNTICVYMTLHVMWEKKFMSLRSGDAYNFVFHSLNKCVMNYIPLLLTSSTSLGDGLKITSLVFPSKCFQKHNPNRNGTPSVKPGKVQSTQKCWLLAEGRKTRKFSLILVTINAIVSNYRGWGFPHLFYYTPCVQMFF